MAERHEGKAILQIARNLVLQLQTLIENKWNAELSIKIYLYKNVKCTKNLWAILVYHFLLIPRPVSPHSGDNSFITTWNVPTMKLFYVLFSSGLGSSFVQLIYFFHWSPFDLCKLTQKIYTSIRLAIAFLYVTLTVFLNR